MPTHGICFKHSDCTPENLLKCKGAVGLAGIQYICWGGTQQLHGYLQANKDTYARLMSVIGVCPMEKQRVTSEQAVDLCKKEVGFIEFGTRVFIDAPKSHKGSRADLEGVLDLIDQGMTYHEICKAYFAFAARNSGFIRKCISERRSMEAEVKIMRKYEGVVWKPWQQSILDLVDAEQDDRKIHWFWEPTGNTGKSWLATYLSMAKDALVLHGGTKAEMDKIFAKLPSKIVIIDTHRIYQQERYVRGMAGFCMERSSAPEPSRVIVLAHTEPDCTAWSLERVAVTHLSE
jgi:hypothetical protein